VVGKVLGQYQISGKQSATSAQVRCQFRACDADQFFGPGIGVIGNDDVSPVPGDPVEITDRTLHIQTTAVGTGCFSDRAAPVVDAGDPPGFLLFPDCYAPVPQPLDSLAVSKFECVYPDSGLFLRQARSGSAPLGRDRNVFRRDRPGAALFRIVNTRSAALRAPISSRYLWPTSVLLTALQ
jgi:hypothetical protein